MPDDYKAVKLPSEKLSPLKGKHIQYIPSWDASQKPPLLSRRPSNNNRNGQSTSVSTNSEFSLSKQSSAFESKLSLPLVSPALSQRTLSDTTTPSLSVLPQEQQSLLLNLRLTDSFLNWVSKNIGSDNFTTTSIQDKTYKIFNIYQNIFWKNTMFDDVSHSLFPEDDPLERTVDLIKKQVGDLQLSKYPFTTDLIEILLKQFSSSLSIRYFHMLLSRYYSQSVVDVSKLEPPKHSPWSAENSGIQHKKLLLDLKPILEVAMQKPIQRTIFEKATIEGPLSLQELNTTGNRLELAPSTNGFLFSYDNDTVSVSPESIKHWQRLFLEPFGGKRNVEYIVVLPDADIVVNGMKVFFKELNTLYEVSMIQGLDINYLIYVAIYSLFAV